MLKPGYKFIADALGSLARGVVKVRGMQGVVGSPVKWAGQEVGGRVQPAHAILYGAQSCHSLVLLRRRALVLRQIIRQIYVLLDHHIWILLEWDYNLDGRERAQWEWPILLSFLSLQAEFNYLYIILNKKIYTFAAKTT